MGKKRDILIGLMSIFFTLLAFRVIGPEQPWFNWTITATRWANALLFIALSAIIYHLLGMFLKDRKLRNITQSIWLVAAGIGLFFVYQDQLLAALISVGVLAVIFTFLFQAPLLSIVAYLYILVGKVYKKGDRIRIGDIKGEVLDVNPLRTELLGIGGEYVASDLPSGRIFTYPNSLVLEEPVCNFTTEYPYVWVDIPLQLTYGTNFDYVRLKSEKIIRKHLKKELKEMKERYEGLLKRHRSEGEFLPIAYNIIPTWSWVEFRITFPVPPKQQSTLTTNITEDLIHDFESTKKVKFPGEKYESRVPAPRKKRSRRSKKR